MPGREGAAGRALGSPTLPVRGPEEGLRLSLLGGTPRTPWGCRGEGKGGPRDPRRGDLLRKHLFLPKACNGRIRRNSRYCDPGTVPGHLGSQLAPREGPPEPVHPTSSGLRGPPRRQE